MHMIDVMKKLQEIAEAGYDNEDIQRGIDAAGKHVVAEAQSPAQKAAFQKMLDAKKGDKPEAEDDEEEAVEEGAVSEKVSNLYPSDPGQDDEGDDEGSDPRLYPDYPEDPGQDDEGDDEGSDPRLYPEDPQIDADIERMQAVADISRISDRAIGGIEDTGGWENIYNADGSLADIAKDSGWTSIGGAKPAPAPNDGVNPGLYPDAPAPNDGVNPGLYPDAPAPNDGVNPGLYPDAPKPYDKINPGLYPDAPAPNDGVNPGLYPDAPKPYDKINPSLYPDNVKQGKIKRNLRLKPNEFGVIENEEAIVDETFKIKDKDGNIIDLRDIPMSQNPIDPGYAPTRRRTKSDPQYPIDPGYAPNRTDDRNSVYYFDKIRKPNSSNPNEFGVTENEEAIVDETVEINVNELAELMQLAGYTNYAEKVEEYANEPEAEYMSAEEQLIGLSGGLNGPKKMYPAAAGGDNPMDQEPREVTESTFDTFYAKYDKFVAELKDSE